MTVHKNAPAGYRGTAGIPHGESPPGESPSQSPADCPVERTLRAVAGRWKALVLFHLTVRERRFNELRRLMPGITQRVLTRHLRELERDGVVRRTVRATLPPHVEYALTTRGRELVPVLDAMASWGDVDRDGRPGPTRGAAPAQVSSAPSGRSASEAR